MKSKERYLNRYWKLDFYNRIQSVIQRLETHKNIESNEESVIAVQQMNIDFLKTKNNSIFYELFKERYKYLRKGNTIKI
jgi:hypothetical protein